MSIADSLYWLEVGVHVDFWDFFFFFGCVCFSVFLVGYFVCLFVLKREKNKVGWVGSGRN